MFFPSFGFVGKRAGRGRGWGGGGGRGSVASAASLSRWYQILPPPSERVLVRNRGRARAQVRRGSGTARSLVCACLLPVPRAPQVCAPYAICTSAPHPSPSVQAAPGRLEWPCFSMGLSASRRCDLASLVLSGRSRGESA